MRSFILSLLSLALLAGCGSKSETKSSGSSSRETLTTSAVVRVSTRIAVERGRIEILENDHERSSVRSSRGDEFECGISVSAGQIIAYRLDGEFLHLTLEGQRVALTKIAGNGEGLHGTWLLERNEGNLVMRMYYQFAHNESMHLRAVCMVRS